MTAAAVGAIADYRYRSKKIFGGITGDTAGYFILFCEGCMVVAAAFANVFIMGE